MSVSVNDGKSVWTRRFYDVGQTHSLPLLGLNQAETNEITVTAYDKSRNSSTAQPFAFVTDPLPANFPNIRLVRSDPSKMEPGYTLFRVGVHNESYWYVVIVDNQGEVVVGHDSLNRGCAPTRQRRSFHAFNG